MFARFRLGQRARASFGLLILLFASAESLAASSASNLWHATFGQNWFYEVRNGSGDVVAGTWWEASLTPGRNYTISFNVQSLRGRIGLLVGGNGEVAIDSTGTYSFDFSIAEGGRRRLLFRALSSNFMATVNRISVTESWTGGGSHGNSGGSNWIPKGHYLSFDRQRNLRSEMQDMVDDPSSAQSNYHLNRARRLHDALQTPGVKGVWMEMPWRGLEVSDGQYDWSVLDANVDVARRHGLKFIVKVADRSFDGGNLLPTWFPSEYVLWSTGGGKSGAVAKRWDPWVYERLIRLHRAIANRYADHTGFGGIATAETAMGNFGASDYSIGRYRSALTQVINQTQAALTNGKLFLYMNFLRGGDNADMNRDQRVALLRDVPHENLVVGAPDITPDVRGMPRSATNYRLHVRRNMPSVEQLCHLQNVDQGLNGINVKTNQYRQQYLNEVARVRERESQSWFNGTPAVFEFDDLRNPSGEQVTLHPAWVLGDLWQPDELFRYGLRNFGCDYVFWHYREYPRWGEFGWSDVRPVILNNQYFYE